MGRMDHQQPFGEEGGNSRHGDPTVSVGNVPINLAGRISCEQLPLGHTRPFLVAGVSITRVLVLRPQPRWLGFELDESLGQNKVSPGFIGVVDRASSRPSKRWRFLSGDFP